ncbi:MAG: hypothetical protein IJJ63_01865 [Bacilli bacterium]|nr:hypothetical protein [Bacilli bacterium]
MNMVYDVMLNYSNENQFFDFYEWDKNDSFLIIQEIPIIKISEKQMIEIEKSIIQVSPSFLNDIFEKSKSIDFQVFTGLLVMNNDKVIGLKFDRNGLLIEKSSLLLDEEMAIIDENQDLCITDFSYTVVSSTIFSFLTRREKKLQKRLLKEVNSFYLRQEYDVINYLYQELFSDKKSSEEQYQLLLDHIQYHYSAQTEKLFDIICLV